MMICLEDYADAQLISALCDGNLDALGVLFNRYYAQVYRTAVVITRDNAVAEDIAQDCFLKLNQYAARIDTNLPLAPWLYRVTVNLSYTWISRRHKRRISIETLVDRIISPPWQMPDRMAEHNETQRQVRTAIDELHINQRIVVVLHYMAGLSLEEIGIALDCPVGTVKSRLYYARENLRHRLSEVQRTFLEVPSYAELL